MDRRILSIILVLLGGRCLAQVAFTSSSLPIIVINTHGQSVVDDPKITADMGIIYNGPGVLNHPTDSANNFKGIIGIEYRGSSSQMFPKKSYSIEVRDNNGNSIDASLLGMPKKDDWVLLAPYDDKSLIRDALAYKLGRDQGRYASRSRYCEVVFDGYYLGVFVLLEKIKRDKNRVNIAKLDPTITTGDDLTGGYIIKIDKTTGSGGEGWFSNFAPNNSTGGQKIYFQYDYPKQEDIVPEQQNYIAAYVNAFETSLAGNHFLDPEKGYANYMDIASMVDFYIMNEVTKNPDGYRLSTYFYKQKDSEGGKLFMGPIWDFNEGFGNVNYCTQGNPEGFVLGFNSICPTDGWQIPFWWDKVFQDDVFKTMLGARWSSLRSGPFQTDVMLNYVDSVAAVLNAGPQQRNFQEWPGVLGYYIWPNYFYGDPNTTYMNEVDWLKNWISQRMMWLDEHIAVVTGLPKDASAFSVHAYPNPFLQDITFEYQIDTSGTVQIEVFDVLGRELEKVQQSYTETGKYQSVVHLQNSSPGIYFFKARLNDQVWVTERLMKF